MGSARLECRLRVKQLIAALAAVVTFSCMGAAPAFAYGGGGFSGGARSSGGGFSGGGRSSGGFSSGGSRAPSSSGARTSGGSVSGGSAPSSSGAKTGSPSLSGGKAPTSSGQRSGVNSGPPTVSGQRGYGTSKAPAPQGAAPPSNYHGGTWTTRSASGTIIVYHYHPRSWYLVHPYDPYDPYDFRNPNHIAYVHHSSTTVWDVVLVIFILLIIGGICFGVYYYTRDVDVVEV